MPDKEILTRKIITNQFGELEFTDDNIFYFEQGMLGFEHLKHYILINDETTEPFQWLISVDEPNTGFPLIDPRVIDLTYDPGEEANFNKYVILAVLTLQDNMGNLSINLKAPIVLDGDLSTGKQIILHSDRYSPTHTISKR